MKPFALWILFTVIDYLQLLKKPVENCSDILLKASKEWKLDSLGCTGFRYNVSMQLMKSKIDSVSKTFLFENCGKPNDTAWFYDGRRNKDFVGYRYLSANFECKLKPYAGNYLEFVFAENDTLLIFIQEIDFP